MEIITQDRVKVKPTTKIFKGLTSLREARESAEESRSYFFRIFIKERNKETKKTETNFYGFGVPK